MTIDVHLGLNGQQGIPRVAMADHSAHEIRAQRFDSNALPVNAEILVSDPLASKPDAPVTSLAGDGSSYLVLHEAEDGDGMGVFASWVPLL